MILKLYLTSQLSVFSTILLFISLTVFSGMMGDTNCDKRAADGGVANNPPAPTGGSIFLRSKLRSALNSSNDIFSSISNRLSMLSHTSTSSHTSDTQPQLPTTPPQQQQTLATREWVEGACAATTEGEADMPGTPESRNSLTMSRFKVTTMNITIVKYYFSFIFSVISKIHTIKFFFVMLSNLISKIILKLVSVQVLTWIIYFSLDAL